MGGASVPQQRLYFSPEPQGQGALRGIWVCFVGIVRGLVSVWASTGAWRSFRSFLSSDRERQRMRVAEARARSMESWSG